MVTKGAALRELGIQWAYAVGLGARPEEDLLERIAGVDEPLERGQLRVRVLARADVVQRSERADAQGPLAVEQADEALLLHLAQDRAATGEVTISICKHAFPEDIIGRR